MVFETVTSSEALSVGVPTSEIHPMLERLLWCGVDRVFPQFLVFFSPDCFVNNNFLNVLKIFFLFLVNLKKILNLTSHLEVSHSGCVGFLSKINK